MTSSDAIAWLRRHTEASGGPLSRIAAVSRAAMGGRLDSDHGAAHAPCRDV